MTGALNVTGAGRVVVTPDRAQVTVAMLTNGTGPGEALEGLAQMAERVRAALLAAGIPESGLRTGYTSVGPRYDQNGVATGHQATGQLVVDVQPLQRAGAIMDAAVGAGATGIDGLALLVGDTGDAYADALAQAMAAATATATRLAATAGRTLGPILEITEGGAAAPPVVHVQAELMRASGKGMPVDPGVAEVTAQVTVRFALGEPDVRSPVA